SGRAAGRTRARRSTTARRLAAGALGSADGVHRDDGDQGRRRHDRRGGRPRRRRRGAPAARPHPGPVAEVVAMTWTTYESPFGPLTLVAGEAGLRALHFPERVPALDLADHDPDALRDVCEQLEQYFAGEREVF